MDYEQFTQQIENTGAGVSALWDYVNDFLVDGLYRVEVVFVDFEYSIKVETHFGKKMATDLHATFDEAVNELFEIIGIDVAAEPLDFKENS